jgi:hypothetical protein
MAMNVALLAPGTTLTEGGTETAEGELLDRAMLEAIGEALERVTVQVVEDEAGMVVLAHWSEVGVGGATSERLDLTLVPFRVAVIVAD